MMAIQISVIYVGFKKKIIPKKINSDESEC